MARDGATTKYSSGRRVGPHVCAARAMDSEFWLRTTPFPHLDVHTPVTHPLIARHTPLFDTRAAIRFTPPHLQPSAILLAYPQVARQPPSFA